MNVRTRMVVGSLIAGLAVCGVARAETIDDVKKKIKDKMASLKSISYKSKSTIDMTNEQMSNKSEGEQTMEAARKGDVILSRMESKSKGVTKFGGQEMKNESTSLMICDGKYVYMVNEVMGQKTAMKMKADKKTAMNPFDPITAVEEHFNLKLLADEKVDGKSCWAIEGTPKDANMKAMMGRSVTYYDKDTGVGIKGVTYDKDGKVTTTSTTTDVKANPSIKPDRFEFKAPPGVTVNDMTGGDKHDDEHEHEDKPAKKGDN